MAVGYLTSQSLIDTVVRESLIPNSQSTFDDDDFLAIANQEIRIGMLPTIMQYHEEFYVRDSADVDLEASVSSYPIPYRAVGGKLRQLFFKDTNDNLYPMTRIKPEERPFYQGSSSNHSPVAFYLQGNDVVLVPDVSASPTGSLVFSYYMRPNELVTEDRVGTITAISEGASTTVFTLDVFPQNLDTFVQDGVTLTAFSTSAKLDILQRRPGHKTINFDITPTAVDTTNKTVTFNNTDLSDDIIVGDIIAFAGECIIPQIPSDLHEILVQRVIKRCMQALGDSEGYKIAAADLVDMEKKSGMLVDNRTEGNAQKINNINSPLQSGRRGRRGRW